MSRLKNPALIALVVALLASCSRTKTPQANVKDDAQRKTAPAFTLKNAQGQAVKLADYKGKVVLVNFWATWCGPCEAEIPWFIEFQQKYKDRDFAVLGISMDDDGWKSVTPYVESHKMNYQVLLGDQVVAQQYGDIDSLPTSFVLDRQGRIAATHIGLVDKRDYQDEILKLLDDPSVALHPGGQLVASTDGANR